jgi:hypothetical protein
MVREGKALEEITQLIHDDEDIAILVLGAGLGKDGPGAAGQRHRRPRWRVSGSGNHRAR